MRGSAVPVVRLPIEAVSRHLEMQVRGRTDPALAKRYARAMSNGEDFPPLGVGSVNGALILFDGFHRLEALEIIGADEMEAIVTPCTSLEELRWLGFQANMRHGERLRPKLWEAAFIAYVKAGKHKDGRTYRSYRDIAKDLSSLSYSTVRRWMQKHFPRIFRAMQADAGGAVGGLPESPKFETVMTREALSLLVEAAAIMEGVKGAGRRRRVALKAREFAAMLDLDGAKTADLSDYISDF